MKNLALGVCALLLAVSALGQGYKPPSGYVPDSATAVKVAEAVLEPVYGKKQIESERPFTAELKGDIWSVTGTLHCPDRKGRTSTDCDGGVATVKISKTNARILFMIHYK
jgi:NTF2 fold immunity protein